VSEAPSLRILVVEDERRLREMVGILLRRNGYEVTSVGGVKEALRTLQGADFDLVLTDMKLADGTGLDVLRAARDGEAATEVVVMTAYATTETAVEAMRLGAYDFLEKPFKNDVLLATIEKALEKRAIVVEVQMLRARVEGRAVKLIGVSQAMRELRELIARAAQAPTSVLITGERGTGKERVARALHEQGPRAAAPFVVVNCGALPEALMESELFGHVKGAFTGASAPKEGLFRAADGGTIFLDEIGELPLSLQVKLLRVLQERKVRPVGAKEELDVDVRVLAATNRDLEAEIAAERFREDLFYRLNVIRVQIPPLRERPEDIRPLAEFLLAKHNALQKRQLALSDAAHAHLRRASYPGNVRELENLLERAVALAPGPRIEPGDLGGGDEVAPVASVEIGDGFDLDAYLEAVERRVLLAALEKAGGVRTRAAKLVGVSFRSFRYRLAKHELAPDE